eukprot:SAG11_NODE_1806_length_4228_cov_6.096391_1_plen_96_part_00
MSVGLANYTIFSYFDEGIGWATTIRIVGGEGDPIHFVSDCPHTPSLPQRRSLLRECVGWIRGLDGEQAYQYYNIVYSSDSEEEEEEEEEEDAKMP